MSIAWNYEWRGESDKPELVMLHGFAGSLSSLNDLASWLAPYFRLLLIDLPGHGGTPVPDTAINPRELGVSLGELLRNLSGQPAAWFGYSMGGRVALHTALYATDCVSSLVLLGASPGIEDPRERAHRQSTDQELADNIIKNGTEWFADYWASLPLFSSQKNLPDTVQRRIRRGRIACSPQGLAYSLRHFGTGEQHYLGSVLNRITRPVLLMAGELDQKFAQLNQLTAAAIGSDKVRQVTIPGAGHAAHIESPDVVAREIVSFTESL